MENTHELVSVLSDIRDELEAIRMVLQGRDPEAEWEARRLQRLERERLEREERLEADEDNLLERLEKFGAPKSFQLSEIRNPKDHTTLTRMIEKGRVHSQIREGETWVIFPQELDETPEQPVIRSDRYPHIAKWAGHRLTVQPAAALPMNVLYADYAQCMRYNVIDAVSQDTLTTELLEIIPGTHLVRGRLEGVAFAPGAGEA